MALPGNLTTREIIGQYLDLAGAYLTGTVEFTIEPILTDGDAGVVIIPTPLIAELDSEGRISITVLTTDDPDVNPTGFRYKVVEKFTGSSGRMFYLDVPGGSAEPIDLSKIVVPGEPVNGETTYVNLGALTEEQSDRVQGDADTLAAAKAYTDDQLVTPSDVVRESSRNQPDGFAGLDVNAKVMAAQLQLSDVASSSVGDVASSGASVEMSRADHVHPGVALSGDQSIAGRKTFTDPTTIRSAIADALLLLEQTDPAAVAGVFKLIGGNATNAVFLGRGQEHTANAWAIRANGTFEVGDGTGGRDCVLSRFAINEMQWTANVRCTEAPTDVSHWTRKDYVDAADTTLQNSIDALDQAAVKLTGDQSIDGIKTFTSIPVGPATDPTTDNQLARKAYVDAVASGGTGGSYQLLSEKNQPSGYAGLDASSKLAGAQQVYGLAADVSRGGEGASAGTVDAAARVDHSHPAPDLWTPEDHGMLAWNFDPGVSQSTPVYSGDDTRRFAAVKLNRPATINNVVWHFTGYAGDTTGSGLTSSSWCGLYDDAGNLLESTQDLGVSSWLAAGVHEDGGRAVEAPLVAPYSAAPGLYYILWTFRYDENHVNGNAGPMLLCAESSWSSPPGWLGINPIYRWGYKGNGGAASAPNPFIASSYNNGSNRFWAGLS